MPKPLPWLEPTDDLPHPSLAWGPSDPAPGLLAAGGDLSVEWLCKAYAQGTFPWFSLGDPILWWSTDPRMVLQTSRFKLHRSLRKTIRRFMDTPDCDIRINTCFETVIQACANTPRHGQDGTWIVPSMVQAYCALHHAGHAHSVETWCNDQLIGGLYFVNIGHAVFGESMFAHQTDASKIALSALVAMGHQYGVTWIDCQQQTQHLASLGAQAIDRDAFLAAIEKALTKPPIHWQFKRAYWENIGV